MENKLEIAARLHQSCFEKSDGDGCIDGYLNGKWGQSYKSFILGAQWQLENMWIPIEEGSPETEDDVLVLIVANGRTFAMTNKFVDRNLFAVPTCLDWKVVAWMPIPKFTKRK